MLDYIEGRNLEVVLAGTPGVPRPADVVDWILQLSRIFQYLYTVPESITYGEFRPSNILLTDDGDICLLDPA